jgi:quaternary ammonium compound-resistance protein SugE
VAVTRAWVLLVLAGLFEVAWAIGLKYTHGFTRPGPSVATGLAIAASMVLLARAATVLPIGTAYAVWTGVGAVGTAALGMVLFGEPRTALRLTAIAMIVAGIVGLRLGAR